MRHGTSSIFMLAAATALAGCASLPNDNAVASNRTRECKIVRVDSAAEAIRNEVRGGRPAGDGLAQAEGVAGVARTQIRPEPRALRALPGTSLTEQALHDC